MAIIQKKRGGPTHYRHFFAFGTRDLITPDPNILKLLDEHIRSPGMRQWAYSVYKKFIVAQMSAASDHQDRFITLIKVRLN